MGINHKYLLILIIFITNNLIAQSDLTTTKIIISGREIDVFNTPRNPAIKEWVKSGISKELIDLNLISIPLSVTNNVSSETKYPLLDLFSIKYSEAPKDFIDSNYKYIWTYNSYSTDLIKNNSSYEIKISPYIEYILHFGHKYLGSDSYRNIKLPKVSNSVSNKILNEEICNYPEKEDKDFWKNVKLSKSPLIITEGMKKSLSLLSNGLLSVSIPGACEGFEFKELVNGETLITLKNELLNVIPNSNKNVYISFDSDHHLGIRKFVWSAAYKLGLELNKLGYDAKIIVIPVDLGVKGVDDFIVKYGSESYRNLMINSYNPSDFYNTFKTNIDLNELIVFEGCNKVHKKPTRYFQSYDYSNLKSLPGYKIKKPLLCE